MYKWQTGLLWPFNVNKKYLPIYLSYKTKIYVHQGYFYTYTDIIIWHRVCRNRRHVCRSAFIIVYTIRTQYKSVDQQTNSITPCWFYLTLSSNRRIDTILCMNTIFTATLNMVISVLQCTFRKRHSLTHSTVTD